MAKVKLTEDLMVPHPSGREGTFHLVARKGAFVDEKVIAAARKGQTPEVVSGLVSSASLKTLAEPVAAPTDAAPDYDGMKVAELRELAAAAGISHDGLKKDELVEALEAL
jgi:hypothetical protein